MNNTSRTMPALITYDDYCQIPHDGNRYEVIDGMLYMSPAPIFKHQRICLKLASKLNEFVESNALGTVLIAPFDILLSEYNIVQPDILFISNERASILNPKNAHGSPDLVIEILSKNNRRYDEVVKKALYERHGVREYWLIDPERDTLARYCLDGDVLKQESYLSKEKGDTLTTPLLPGFSSKLNGLFSV